MHRFDGTEQYFARAIDFGYSFSVDETYRKWGRQEILADYVRMIRTIRPDVIVTMRPEGEMGGAHHQAQARITGEAFRLAADPTALPGADQGGPAALAGAQALLPGVVHRRPTARRRRRGQLASSRHRRLRPAARPDLRRRSDSQARSNHKCQGMAQLLFLPGRRRAARTYRLGDTTLPGGTDRAETDAVRRDRHEHRRPRAVRQGAGARRADRRPRRHRARRWTARRRRSRSQGPERGAGADRRRPRRRPRAARRSLPSLGLDEAARFEIDYRLKTKEDQFQQAAVLAQGVRIDVLADDGVVFGGQPMRVQTIVANRGRLGPDGEVDLAVRDSTAIRRARPPSVKGGAVMPRCDANVKIPADARV